MALDPQTFWTMSVAEWRAAAAGWQARNLPKQSAPLSRGELDHLMEAYPDGR
jgi:uncharacterized phage protein (TIGR02216 family)